MSTLSYLEHMGRPECRERAVLCERICRDARDESDLQALVDLVDEACVLDNIALVSCEACFHLCELVAGCHDAPAAALRGISERHRKLQNSPMKSILVDHPNADAETLKAAVDNSPVWVRQAAGRHPNLDAQLLSKLAADKDPNVSYQAIANARMPAKDLRYFATSPNHIERAAAASNPGAPEDLLERLAGDSHHDVRVAVTLNPSSPPAVLQDLSEQFDTHLYVVHNPSVPQSIIDRLSRHELVSVRAAVAGSKVADLGTITMLMADESMDVRMAATRTMRTRENHQNT